jgi:hypothetical protein
MIIIAKCWVLKCIRLNVVHLQFRSSPERQRKAGFDYLDGGSECSAHCPLHININLKRVHGSRLPLAYFILSNKPCPATLFLKWKKSVSVGMMICDLQNNVITLDSMHFLQLFNVYSLKVLFGTRCFQYEQCNVALLVLEKV